MNILYITNFLYPEVAKSFGLKGTFANGWVYAAAKDLVKRKGVRLAIATVGAVKDLKKAEFEGVLYYVMPQCKSNNKRHIEQTQSFFNSVNSDFRPDVVHLYGTEYLHSYAYIQTNSKNVVISIQGLVGAYSKYFLGGLSRRDVYSNITIRDILKGTLFRQQKKFAERGIHEMKAIGAVSYLEGRTNWDRSICWSINPRARYYSINRILREPFYASGKWNYQECDKYTIFLSQAHYSVKGAHQVIKALPLILRYYPETRIVIGGNDSTKSGTFSEWMHYGGYGKYLKHLINSLGVGDRISFTGPLSANEICKQYLRANVFICSSSIENAPNSIAEAQILGVPVVASYAGGNPEMVTHGVDGYVYRFEEVEMLADIICQIFKNKECLQLSKNEIVTASARHDKRVILDQLWDMYQDVYNGTNLCQ